MTRGDVEEWADGEWHCKIICTRDGHPKRLIDRLKVTDDQGDCLYGSGSGYMLCKEYGKIVSAHHMLYCPMCHLDVRVDSKFVMQFARGLRDVSARTIQLHMIAAIVSRQEPPFRGRRCCGGAEVSHRVIAPQQAGSVGLSVP